MAVDALTKLKATPTNRTFGYAYFTQDLVAKVAREFPGTILIVDGCETAKTLDFKTPAVKLVVGVDWLYALVVLGAFSEQFATVVSPQSFNDFDNDMPLTVSCANLNLRAPQQNLWVNCGSGKLPSP